MTVRIAIPEPTSSDTEYNQRSLPPYIAALHAAGATPVLVPLHERQDRVARLLAGVHGVLLPGSGYDVDPQRFGEPRIPECGPADPGRTAVDELLLQDAFNLRKPILAICHGAQSLNVWRNGSLIQDLETAGQDPRQSPPRPHQSPRPTPSTSPPDPASPASSRPARSRPRSTPATTRPSAKSATTSASVAVSPDDGVVEAVELDSPDQFVVAVQWHPERTYTVSAFSRAIFAAFVQAAGAWQPPRVEDPPRSPPSEPRTRTGPACPSPEPPELAPESVLNPSKSASISCWPRHI